MKLRTRLGLLIGFSALLPLLFTAITATNIADSHSLRQTRELYTRKAESLSLYTHTWFDMHPKGLATAVNLFPLEGLSPEEQEGLLRLIFRQFQPVNVAVVATREGEVVAGPLVAEGAREITGGLRGHEVVDDERLAAFTQRVPLLEGAGARVALGEVYVPPGSAAPVVPLTISTNASDGLLISVELSLRQLERQFIELASDGNAAVLLQNQRAVVGEPGALVDPEVTGLFTGEVSGDVEYALPDGTAVMAAFVSVGQLPYTVVVALPRSIATAAGDEIRGRTFFMYGMALVMATLLGIVGARQMARPIVSLKDAALEVAEGKLGHSVEVSGGGEVAELSHAFNFMSRRLASDKQQIDEKNREIEAFNEELQERVIERTRQLEEAHARLVKTTRLAAVGQLGAGLAHELNNPVAAILGLSQIGGMKASGTTAGLLKQIEEEAQRCREILATMTRFTNRERPPYRETLLAPIFEEVRGELSPEFEAASLELKVDIPADLSISTHRETLQQALVVFMRSLRGEALPGGIIAVSGAVVSGGVELWFDLQGERRGSGDDRLATGLGLWVARYVMREQDGSISEPEEGDAAPRYTLRFPTGEESA